MLQVKSSDKVKSEKYASFCPSSLIICEDGFMRQTLAAAEQQLKLMSAGIHLNGKSQGINIRKVRLVEDCNILYQYAHPLGYVYAGYNRQMQNSVNWSSVRIS
ncbi:MAG: hypothetical protein MZV63_56975 [Marinilabiliales bacterium]|nr:hypothetical protein [Marinilabiliales bacterium]